VYVSPSAAIAARARSAVKHLHVLIAFVLSHVLKEKHFHGSCSLLAKAPITSLLNLADFGALGSFQIAFFENASTDYDDCSPVFCRDRPSKHLLRIRAERLFESLAQCLLNVN
jgi:hypothetical protein